MTRSAPVRPDDLPPPDLATLARSFISGEPMTVWRCGMVTGPIQASVYGLGGAGSMGGAGWLHATCRVMGGTLLLLVGHGRGTKPTWASVAQVTGKQVTWSGIVEPMHTCRETRAGDHCALCLSAQVRDMRSRLVVSLLRSLRYTVKGATYQDGKMLDTDKVLTGATCQADGCNRLLTTPESILSGYGPTCGGRVKPKRTWANINLGDAMRERMK